MVDFTEYLLSSFNGFSIKSYDYSNREINVSYLNNRVFTIYLNNIEFMSILTEEEDNSYYQLFGNLDQIKESIKNTNIILKCIKLILENKKKYIELDQQNWLYNNNRK